MSLKSSAFRMVSREIYVLGFYQDRENGIWVVTSGGVDYFHPRKITTFSKREGLSGDGRRCGYRWAR